jgi:hypothetical protein
VKTVVSHHHSSLNEPTTGAVRADNGYFYLLAATGVTHYARSGKIERPRSRSRPVVCYARCCPAERYAHTSSPRR